MKNEQNKTGKQGQTAEHAPLNKQQEHSKNAITEPTKQQGANKSNISIDNDGKIGKAHDRWPIDDKKENQDIQKDNRPARSDKTVTKPEIDAPIYDPEKTEKKIPKM